MPCWEKCYMYTAKCVNTVSFFCQLLSLSFVVSVSKVPCCQVVAMARAELAENPRANLAVQRFAKIPLDNAEEGCHTLFKELGFCAPITIHFWVQNEVKVPYLKLSDWVQWLLDTDRLWCQMVGVPSWEKMQVVLGEFWFRYGALYPDHEVFSLPVDFKRTIPFYSHTDEGRTYKSKAIWILSVHGALGRGTQAYVQKGKHRAKLNRLQMGMNFIGNTWSTHFMFTSLVRQFIHDNSYVLDALVEVFAADCAKLLHEGVTSADGTKQVFLVHLNTKGDLPALSKLGGFTRSFHHVARAASSKAASSGICHLCLGGQESDGQGQTAYPYEDFSLSPSWGPTMHTSLPWTSEPRILASVPVVPGQKAQFFETDIWHNMHLGCLKHWLGSGFVTIIERLDVGPLQGSVDAKFSWLTTNFRAFCREKRKSPYMSEISRATLGFPASTATPVGQWSKGQVSTHFCQYLEAFCDQYIVGQTEDPMLLRIVDLL